uniref:Uncharacterized protein n=1 Tax=Minutocellus polymorphus TaxID=265543 RepID=A0A7S0FVD3_9STRA|mmetsp:Transcript_914/g.1581  ORF Transcript_914/g.1581 Transcript_914/m.1581 type:complete len:300 (+) Transcript_914:42-941(+)
MTTTAVSTSTFRPRARSGSILSSQRLPRASATGNGITRKERAGQCGPAMTIENPLKVSFRQGALRPKSALPSSLLPKSSSSASTTTSSPSRGAKRPASSAAVAIPLPSSHIPRTKSELQLREDTAAAEWADLAMFHRLVNGMRSRNQKQLQEQHLVGTSALAQQRRQDDELRRRLQHERQRSGLFPPAPSRGTRHHAERCINSIISTRQPQPQEEQGQDQDAHRIVSPETTATTKATAAAEKDPQRHDRLETLHSALFQAANEDWSLEGYDDKAAKEEDAAAAATGDDAADDGIFSLDL